MLVSGYWKKTGDFPLNIQHLLSSIQHRFVNEIEFQLHHLVGLRWNFAIRGFGVFMQKQSFKMIPHQFLIS